VLQLKSPIGDFNRASRITDRWP